MRDLPWFGRGRASALMQPAVLVATEKLAAGENRFATRQMHATLETTNHVFPCLHRRRRRLLIPFHTGAIALQKGNDQPYADNQQQQF